MEQQDLIPHLFRTEFGRITSVLCRQFGIEHLEVAEDIASETFLLALETWSYRGIPGNPVGWLHTVAKNKTRNFISRNRLFAGKILPTVRQSTLESSLEVFSDKNISDSQLQMMFALCHPVISPEVQITISLRVLCGFGVEEIATALLTSKKTIHKRLFRAKEKLRHERIPVELPGPREINRRLGVVLATLYLLFNEGYHSESHPMVVRKDLCLEAIRLVRLLADFELTNRPEVNALLALMCFHASRLHARKNPNGELVLYDDQDEALWNTDLIAHGVFYLNEASKGENLSKYHLEATIAYWHTQRPDTRQKWEQILHLFDILIELDNSPVVMLNRIVAFSRVAGTKPAIEEAEKLSLNDNHYYFTLLGELYREIDADRSRDNFLNALRLARTSADRNLIESKIRRLA